MFLYKIKFDNIFVDVYNYCMFKDNSINSINNNYLITILSALFLISQSILFSGCITLEVVQEGVSVSKEEKAVVEEIQAPKNGLKVKGYMRDWIVCGPCPNEDAGTRLSYDYLQGEAMTTPSEEEPIGEWKWKKLKVSDPVDPDNLSQGDVYGPQSDCVVYLFAYVYSPLKQNVKLLVGSDDGIAVWLNKKRVHFNDVERKMKVDSDKVTCTFEKGYNKLLLKVSQSKDTFGFCARVVNDKNVDIDNLLVVLANPGN